MNQPPPPNPQQQPGQFAPYPGAPGGWQGGPPLPPPPPPKGGRTGLVIGLSAALAIAVVALVIVLLTKNGDGDNGSTANPGGAGTHGTSGTGGTGGGATAAPARPSAQHQQQAQPKTDYERAAFAYVSAIQNNDLATAQSLTCASFRPQVKVAPLGLRSPTGVVVDKVDTFQLGGANAITDSDPGDTGDGTLVKAKVGIRVQDGANGVHWIFDVRPDHGEAKVCGQSVLDLRDLVPDVD